MNSFQQILLKHLTSMSVSVDLGWPSYIIRATHSSVLALRIPGTGEHDGLLSMRLHRVGHDWSDLAAAAAAAIS